MKICLTDPVLTGCACEPGSRFPCFVEVWYLVLLISEGRQSIISMEEKHTDQNSFCSGFNPYTVINDLDLNSMKFKISIHNYIVN